MLFVAQVEPSIRLLPSRLIIESFWSRPLFWLACWTICSDALKNDGRFETIGIFSIGLKNYIEIKREKKTKKLGLRFQKRRLKLVGQAAPARWSGPAGSGSWPAWRSSPSYSMFRAPLTVSQLIYFFFFSLCICCCDDNDDDGGQKRSTRVNSPKASLIQLMEESKLCGPEWIGKIIY